MSKKPRYLTKSRYKLALECPTKLYYTKKSKEYADNSLDDDFLRALADGGFQVGALAKCYYPGGHDIKPIDYDEALKETYDLLEAHEDVVIFEAAIQHKDLFIRVDILEKKGNDINLIEVKAKSSHGEDGLLDNLWAVRPLKKGIHSMKKDWKPYVYDVAFQTYVTKSAHPEWNITPFLMLSDKSKVSTVNGLNQKFLLTKENGQTDVKYVGDVSMKALGQKILCNINVSEAVNKILEEQEMSEKADGRGFKEGVEYYSDMYSQDERIKPKISKECKSCQFRTCDSDLKSGFSECFKLARNMTDDELKGPFSFDVWKANSKKHIENGVFLMKDLEEHDITNNPRSDDMPGLTAGDRKLLQITKTKENDDSSYLDIENLKEEYDSFTYPLHFIDFETSMAAIPFNAGRKPYEQTAFQFSHHTVDENGRIEHVGQFINTTPGHFPNFDFVRALKRDLDKDNGTIFRYSNHENTVLCQIYEQLDLSEEPDRKELMEWIKTVTKSTSGLKGKGYDSWRGERLMIDLCNLVERLYFNPATGGSNSIKYVLPAILNESEYLKNKYSKSIYGKSAGIQSQNFEKIAWLSLDNEGNAKDPYKLLPPAINDYDRDTLDLLMSGDDIRNGGAAMTAYAYLQFVQMSEEEREKIRQALLKYCELDTLAMVMIFEAWREMIKEHEGEEKAS